jgi:anthranilate synthase component 1
VTPRAATLPAATRGPRSRTVAGFPDLAALHQANPARYPYLLESVARGSAQTRYDILFAFPGRRLAKTASGELSVDGAPAAVPGFLDALDRVWSAEAAGRAHGETLLPFTGGWFLYLGYELAAEVEPALGELPTDASLPVAVAQRIPAAIIRDHVSQTTTLVCEAEHVELLELMSRDLENLRDIDEKDTLAVTACYEEPPARYLEGVSRAKAYIHDGDVFQVNLSRPWQVQLAEEVDAASVYRRLRRTNPAPYAGLAHIDDDHAIISSSPERLVAVRGERIVTRPIAGTYPRGRNGADDRRLSRELVLHPKERAEHVMLIDLERNDLGRVCRTGSISVPDFMVVETYEHVHHIVSEVTGILREGVSPARVIRAVFPGGTITGCPKVRCMEIIAELECSPRGAYTGAMGYLNHDGSMDLNILIRTMVSKDKRIELRAGAGIVADSVPERELAETRAKARGMLRALGLD